MGSKQMNALLSQFMKDEYADVKQDLYGAFVVRGIELVDRCGLLAIVIGDTWMSLKSFEALRTHLLDGHTIDSLLHLRDSAYHADTFGANTAFVLSMAGDCSRRAPFVRLTPLGSDDKEQDLKSAIKVRRQDVGYFLASGEDFASIPGTPIVYWLSEKFRAVWSAGHPLNAISEPRQGLITGDGESFVRLWWECSASRSSFHSESRTAAKTSHARWFPYNKGGEFRKWYGNHEYLVNWEDDGREVRNFGVKNGGRARSRPQNADFYFRQSVSWSNVSSGAPAFRSYPPGFIAAGSTGDGVYPESDGVATVVLGVLNSAVAMAILAATSPTLTFNVGTIAVLPVMWPTDDSDTVEAVAELVTTSKEDWDSCETSWGFERNPLVVGFERN
jgi:hypothetical protein